MGDGDVKPPPLPKNAPKDLVDFVDCKSDSTSLKGGAQAWIGTIDLGIANIAPDVTFEKGEKDGTINVVVGKGGFGITLPVSVDANGQLSVDTSNLPAGKIPDTINDWVKKFNDHLKAKGKKLGGLTLKNGDVTITKVSLVAVAPGGVKLGPNFVMNAPAGAQLGAGLLVAAGLGFGIGFANYAGGSTTTTTSVAGPVAPGPVVPVPVPPPLPNQPSTVTLVGGQACVQAQGAASIITVSVFTTNTLSGAITGTLSMVANGQAVGSPISATGKLANGQGNLSFPITDFGTYGNLGLTSPSLGAVSLGPVSSVFPYTVASDNQPCAQAGTLNAAAPSPAPSPTPSAPSAPSTSVPTGETTTVTTTKTTGPPWSLLAIPGSLVAATGLLLLTGDTDDAEPEDAESDDGESEGGEPEDDNGDDDGDDGDDDDDWDGEGEEPCGCALDVSIESVGHDDDITACMCGTMSYTCNPPDERVTTLSATYNARGSSETTFYQQQYEVIVTPKCTGDGSVVDYVYHWSTAVSDPPTGGDGYVELTCTVHATLRCPGEQQRTISNSDYIRITLHEARPTVQAIHRRPDPNNPHDFGHASLRIRCGSMDLVYGFYPPNATVMQVLVGEAPAAAGVEAGGVGVSHQPPVGEHFSGLKSTHGYDVYTFVVDCSQLQKIISYWNDLMEKSSRGTLPPYALLWNNCTTQVLDSLRQAGVADAHAVSPSGLSGLDDGANHVVVPPR